MAADSDPLLVCGVLRSHRVFLIKALSEGQRFSGIRGVGRLLMLTHSVIAPTEADVRRFWIPAETARKAWSFSMLHDECVFLQSRHSVKCGRVTLSKSLKHSFQSWSEAVGKDFTIP